MATHKCRKRFGQNFLTDGTVIEQIVQSLHPTKQDHLIEIGPGLGAITAPLLPLVNNLDAIELDRELIPKLQTKFNHYTNFAIHQGDILKFDLNSIIKVEKNVRIIGNLPYNISTPLLFYLLHYTDNIVDMHFMVQKEVADRLAATPGTKNYGRLSIMIQYHCNVDVLFAVKATSFHPAPKVTSAFICLKPRENKTIAPIDFNLFANITTIAFNQRRKTIQNSLKTKFNNEDFAYLNIDPKLRPEQLSVENFVQLSNYAAIKQKTAG